MPARSAAQGVEILSTGGTAKALEDAGIPVRDVAEHTGFPEMMDGRLKTLHPKVHGGLLAIRGNAEHDRAAAAHGIAPIDLLVVNLYPFEATAAKGAAYEECVENIDIGGPAMIRAAAKNHAAVTVVVEPEDYARVLADMAAHGGAHQPRAAQGAGRQGLRAHRGLRCGDRRLVRGRAGRAGAALARLRRQPGAGAALRREPAPVGRLLCRRASARPGVATAVQHQGKELSYNNLNDTDAAFELVAEFDPDVSPAVAIIKHANPCGVALGRTLARGLRQGAALRSRQRLRRHHRAQRPDRRRDGRGRSPASSPRW